MQNLTTMSAKNVAALIREKKVSCLEVMQAHLDRVKKVNPALNAIIQQLPHEEALKQARDADQAIAQNKPIGKLHGIPITIKDARKVKGFLCTYGNESPMNFIAK